MIRRYVINKTIYFYPDERKIESMADGRSCMLHTPAALCFAKLLEVNGDVVSQSELQEAGWGEELSKHTTQASYYQCFVNLRKQFFRLGFEEKLLITVPRRGMQINPYLEIESEQYALQVSAKDEMFFPEKVRVDIKKNARFNSDLAKFRWMLALLLALAAMLVAYNLHLKFKNYFDDYQLVDGIGNCYFFKDPKSDEIKNTVMTLQDNGYNCAMDKNFYIYKLRHMPRTTFFVCDKVSDERCYSVTIMSKQNEHTIS